MGRCRVGVVAIVVALSFVGPTNAARPLSAPAVERALVAAGYPARSECGFTLTPAPHHATIRTVGPPTCAVVVERGGYSISVVPYATKRLARLAFASTRNPAARATREVAIGTLLVSAYRLPSGQWARVSKLVESVVAPARR